MRFSANRGDGKNVAAGRSIGYDFKSEHFDQFLAGSIFFSKVAFPDPIAIDLSQMGLAPPMCYLKREQDIAKIQWHGIFGNGHAFREFRNEMLCV